MRIITFSGTSVLVCALLVHALPEATPKPQAQSLPFTEASLLSPNGVPGLQKRQQGQCQANFISCESLGSPEACCPNGTRCAKNGAGQIACCANNFACTDGAGGGSGSGSSTTSRPAIGGTTSMSTTAGITPAPNPGSAVTAGSTVPNAYYPFPYIVTTYSNADTCLSAFTFCQQQSSSCYASLGGQNGVTVSNGMGGGGVTQNGGGVAPGSASSICSSLSAVGCYALQSSQCAQFGNAGGTGVVQQGHGPRETGCVGARYMAAMGLVGAIGLAV